jgi:CDP-diacylglycerol---serine O-phosphatidyltransferase
MLHDAIESLVVKNYLTLANAASGFLAIYYALSSNPLAAIVFVFISFAFDYLDGKVARETGKSNEMGRQLDSLSDVVSFGVAPAIIVISYTYSSIALVFAICYVCAGILRLAAFNLQKEPNVYYGLPIPAAALIVCITVYSVRELSSYMLLVSAVLMVLKVKIHKPKF